MNYKYMLTLFFGLFFFSLTNVSAKPAKPETIHKYLEVTHSKKAFEQLHEIRKAYYLELATQRVLYHIQAPTLDARLLTPQQHQVAEKMQPYTLKLILFLARQNNSIKSYLNSFRNMFQKRAFFILLNIIKPKKVKYLSKKIL